jgi:hypothetical protein
MQSVHRRQFAPPADSSPRHVFSGGTGLKIVSALGGGFLAKALGYGTAFILFITCQIATGLTLGCAGGWFSKKWPDNHLNAFLKWFKKPSSESDYENPNIG